MKNLEEKTKTSYNFYETVRQMLPSLKDYQELYKLTELLCTSCSRFDKQNELYSVWVAEYRERISVLEHDFEVEKNIKNNLYAFILQNYGLEKLYKYECKVDMSGAGGHEHALQYLALSMPEVVN